MSISANWLSFLGLFGLVGAGGARFLFARLFNADPSEAGWRDADAIARRIGVTAAVVLLFAAAFRLLAQAESFLDPGEYLSLDAVRAVLTTAWGRGWWTQVVAGALATITSLAAPGVALLGGLIACITIALTGHATESPLGLAAGVSLHGLHAFAGGLWLGTLSVGLIAWKRAHSHEASGRRHARLAELIARFSPLALASALVLVASGVAESLWLVGSVANLTGTAYGRRLLLKLGLFLLLLVVGGWNWRVVRPKLGNRQGSRSLRRAAALELLLAVAILGVTASLVTMQPGE